MTQNTLILPIILPVVAGILVLIIGKRLTWFKEALTLLTTAACLFITIKLFNTNMVYHSPWAGFGMDFSLRLYNFSAFIILAISFFAFLISLYSANFMRQKSSAVQFYAYFLICVGFAHGAVLSDNLLLLLFFWEGLLLSLFGLIAIGGKGSFKTAIKAFIIVGISDLCMMIGIALTAYLAGTLTISQISLSVNAPLAGLAFIFLMIGAISKGGSMPFHSWIPDAANDAPLPFMAFVPASLEKLLGIYFLTRISLDMFKLQANSWISTLLMVVGGITIILAVMMALIQKEYKRLLSYHAISQVGYMILGIGTCLPVGIVGGLFHMINNALYKSCLFLTGGSVEKQCGTTKLERLGGLWRKMPITFICFLVTAASISGMPPFNGFFSKELIYDAALERGMIFYLAAIIGSFLTAASFLKLGASAFTGKLQDENKNVKEVKWPMLVPMIVIAAICIFFGLRNDIAILKFIQPVIGAEAGEHHFYGWPENSMLVVITVLVLIAAFLHHIFNAKKMGGALHAADHIRHAPVLSGIFDKAERKVLDPYEIGWKIVTPLANILHWFDRRIDWVYDNFSVGVGNIISFGIRRAHNGNYATYIIWSVLGSLLAILFMRK